MTWTLRMHCCNSVTYNPECHRVLNIEIPASLLSDTHVVRTVSEYGWHPDKHPNHGKSDFKLGLIAHLFLCPSCWEIKRAEWKANLQAGSDLRREREEERIAKGLPVNRHGRLKKNASQTKSKRGASVDEVPRKRKAGGHAAE